MNKKSIDSNLLKKIPAYQHMRLKLLSENILNKSGDAKVIGLMSRTKGEGVSTTSAGLAMAINSRSPKSVLLIDANPLGNRLANVLEYESLELDPNSIDREEVDIANYIVGDEVKLLSLCAQGNSQTCSHTQFNMLLQSLKNQYDNIIIDIGSWDTESPLGWIEQIDSLILVIDGNTTTREMLAHFKKTVDRCGIKLNGFVMNKHEKPVPTFIYKMIS
ncbi:hypothetical protein [Aliiglaciecola sp. LCG003]|uniref:hypothetical protein n=1 Tax=Aliiglaciecola sp. LCG003 TaxID=3053655 RepID=UPI002572624D|nr:hypothetical protein [Aliiglaciecola sp. LCG003]WJG09746.1 hypothetical protein QR722_01525 [Aliiglaciecola sp. LCG003]